jgi:uncharacterized membrane protein YoaK (UPF0700 family)
MGIFQWAEKKTKGMTIWDIGVLKVYCVLFGVIVGAYLSSFVREHVLWFVVSVLVLGGGVGYRWFTADST